MNVLFEIISSLNKEEARFYKIFAERAYANYIRKDLLLFDKIRNSKSDYNEKKTREDLYGRNKNSFYQLKNRLYKDLNKSMLLQYLEKDKEVLIMKYILLSRTYKRKGNINLAWHFLKKSEKESIKIEAFEILSVIYSDILNLAQDLISIDIKKYISKKRENKKNLDWMHEIDMSLSLIMYKIKTAQNYSKVETNIGKLIEKTLLKINKQDDESKSPKFKLKIFQIISRQLLLKNDFKNLESYLLTSYKEFIKSRIFNRSNHEQKLILLTYLTNCFYKNNKLEKSLEFAELLNESLEEFNGLLKSKYLFYYYNALVINYSKLDKNEALKILKKAKNNTIIQKLPVFGSFIYLNTALIYYSQEKFKLASQQISRLILQKDFIDLDNNLQFKIVISELLIRYKLAQYNTIKEKILLIKKQYTECINKNSRDQKMLLIIEEIIDSSHNNDKKLEKKIKSLSNKITDKQATDEDIINYNTWLQDILHSSN